HPGDGAGGRHPPVLPGRLPLAGHEDGAVPAVRRRRAAAAGQGDDRGCGVAVKAYIKLTLAIAGIFLLLIGVSLAMAGLPAIYAAAGGLTVLATICVVDLVIGATAAAIIRWMGLPRSASSWPAGSGRTATRHSTWTWSGPRSG